ncbi:MAG: response regulator [Alphaproteobacteria bacterium]
MRMEQLSVLLVEDDEVDRMAVRRALREHGIDAQLVEARDGQEALDIISGNSETAPPPAPYFILLDLNMPRVNGIDFLHCLRGEGTAGPARDAIVFVLTTSQSRSDIQAAYRCGISGYFVKSDYDQSLRSIVELMSAFQTAAEFPEADA